MRDIKVYYWLGQPNFSDKLNIDICHNLFSINPVETCPQDCEATFIGSVLDDFLYKKIFRFSRTYNKLIKKDPINIWGSGFIADKNCYVKRPFRLPEVYYRRANVYTVRGVYSKNRLQNILKKDLTNVVVGDPGLLASHLLSKEPVKKYRLGIIPHHMESGYALWDDISQRIPKSIIIRMDNGNVMDTIKKISECDAIISSALHGLIVADSLNIPNMRIRVSDILLGGDYKFNDYYSVYGIEKPYVYDIRNKLFTENDINRIYEHYNIKQEDVNNIQKQLYNCFPYRD